MPFWKSICQRAMSTGFPLDGVIVKHKHDPHLDNLT